MVRALYGKCNGRDIVLSPVASGRWSTAVPTSPNATYIIELWAEDEAGNRSYFATLKVEYDTSRLCMRIYVTDIGAAWSMEDVQNVFSMTPAFPKSCSARGAKDEMR